MKHRNPKENIPLCAISVIALAAPLSGYVFKGLAADIFSVVILFPIILSISDNGCVDDSEINNPLCL